jgi:hypothetical protein
MLDLYFQLSPYLETLLRLAHLPANYAFYVAVALPALVWVGFAFWGALRAENGGHSFSINFIIGMAIPVAYPLTVPLIISRERRKRRVARLQAEEEAKHRKVQFKERHRPVAQFALQGKKKSSEGEPQMALDSPEFPAANEPCVRYFSSIERRQTEDSGARLHIEYGDGEELETERILEVFPKTLVVQTWNDNVQNHQSVRIPYAKIVRARVLP